jgi:LmbE family N-acetylglucosaminyl deacetylase
LGARLACFLRLQAIRASEQRLCSEEKHPGQNIADPSSLKRPTTMRRGMMAETMRIEAKAEAIPMPHQPEQCDFKVHLLLDITPVFDRKCKAMEVMAAQEHLIRYYTELARRRGVQFKRNAGKVGSREAVFAEAYQRVYPQAATELK